MSMPKCSFGPCQLCRKGLDEGADNPCSLAACRFGSGSAGEIPECLRYVIPDILGEGILIAYAFEGREEIVFVNQRFAQMCERSSLDLIGRCLSELYSEEHYAQLKKHLSLSQPSSDRECYSRFEFVVPHGHDGSTEAMFSLREISVSPDQTLLVICVTDVSELKHAQRAVQDRQALLDDELDLAARVQRSLFPERVVENGVEVVSVYRPVLSVGGDYAWVSSHEDDSVHVIVGDVSGHGIAASLVANRLVTEAAHYAVADRNPADLLVALNKASLALMREPTMFCTVAALRIDVKNRQTCFSGAGHPPAFLARRSGVVEPIYSQHRILGILEDIGPPGAGVCWRVEEGDQLIMYTDGLPELRNNTGEMMGYQRLREVIRNAIGATGQEMADHIMKAADEFGGKLEDDTTLCVVTMLD